MQWLIVILIIVIFWSFFKWLLLLLAAAFVCISVSAILKGATHDKEYKIRQKKLELEFDPANPCGATGYYDPRHPDYQAHRIEPVDFVPNEDAVPKHRISAPPRSPLISHRLHAPSVTAAPNPTGGVYLLKSGRYYKIGKASVFDKRIKQIKLQQPEPVEVVHKIHTHNATDAERQWHKRFAHKRKNGEWFELSDQEVAEFKRRSRM